MNFWDVVWTVVGAAVITGLLIIVVKRFVDPDSKPSGTDGVSGQSFPAQFNSGNRSAQNTQLTDEQIAEGARMAKALGHGEEAPVGARPIRLASQDFYPHPSDGACLDRWHHTGDRDENGLTFTGLGLRKVV